MASSYRLTNGEEVSNFGESINDHEDGIISFLGFWKASDEIHTDFVPFPLGNRQRLKSTSRSLMFCLNATTNITFGNEQSNLSFHPSQPKSLASLRISLLRLCFRGTTKRVPKNTTP